MGYLGKQSYLGKTHNTYGQMGLKKKKHLGPDYKGPYVMLR